MYERVTKKQSKAVREYVEKLIKEAQKALKPKYKFAYRIVGSAKYNTIIKNKDKYWDIDYQLLLSENSKEYKNNELSKPTQIKNDFFNYFNEKFKNKENFTVQNSTTAITIINNNEKYSIDIVIIRLIPENNEIIRRNNKKNSSINEFTWNELPQFNEAYDKFNKLHFSSKIDLIENYIIPRKIKEKNKLDSNPTKKSSCQSFVEEVNNYVSRK